MNAEWFKISLAEWSLHRSIFGGTIDPLDFPVVARQTYDIGAVEYVNSCILPFDSYVKALKKRAEGEGVESLLIMVDEAGRLGDVNAALRRDAVERHKRWLDYAQLLGCKAIRVNARSEGSAEEQLKLMADGLRQLCEEAYARGLNVLVENHGGFSSHGDWVAKLMQTTNHPRAGTLPDFGNWYPDDEYGGPPRVEGVEATSYYDRYQGIDEMMPFAKGVSAKSYAFDAEGNETSVDYERMIKIVQSHHFTGYIGVEYEGAAHSEEEGIRATKALLEKLRAHTAE
ncbi:MAG: sugar phosphate isomerase/epimerase [Rhodothermaceae bacterium]|nr:sugar phosphate isomerase/epimerase [Rhodothermaceae bacterium]